MNHILIAAAPAILPMLGSAAGQTALTGKKVVLLLGFTKATPDTSNQPIERKNWRDHRPPPRWGINE